MRKAMKPKRGRPTNEAQRRRRRETILEMATKLFAARGYPKTDLQEVADALKVGKGTLYRYFPTKEALFLAAVDRGILRIVERANRESVGIQAPLLQLTAGIRAHYHFFMEHPEVIELFVQERAEFHDRQRPTYFDLCRKQLAPWERLLKKMMRQGQIRTYPARWLMDALGGLLFGMVYDRPKMIRGEADIDRVLDLLFHGLLTPRGRSAVRIHTR